MFKWKEQQYDHETHEGIFQNSALTLSRVNIELPAAAKKIRKRKRNEMNFADLKLRKCLGTLKGRLPLKHGPNERSGKAKRNEFRRFEISKMFRKFEWPLTPERWPGLAQKFASTHFACFLTFHVSMPNFFCGNLGWKCNFSYVLPGFEGTL